MKAIILYYSRSGNTEKLARRISTDIKCDMLKIEPKERYGNYVSSMLRVMKEDSKNIAAGYATDIPDLSVYDIVLIGFPTWNHDLPTFVEEFLSHCDLRDKTVIPFTTFGMGGIDWDKNTIQKACKGATIKAPLNYGLKKKGNYDEWLASIKSAKGK